MLYKEYLSLQAKEIVQEFPPPATLTSYQSTKIGMHSVSGLSIHNCPGKSNLCSSKCYDAKSRIVLLGGKKLLVKRAYYAHYAQEDPELLFSKLKKDLPNCTEVIRVHVGGDFFTNEQVDVWKRLAKQFPYKRFFGYTRSWRDPYLKEKLLELKDAPNFTLFASTDSETGLPPVEEQWRTALMTQWAELDRNIVCPEQTGQVESCAVCKLCFGNKKVKTNITFMLHGQGRKMDKSYVLRKDN